ncbi:MAG TPA: AMP-binding protein [Gammaproteobacteria bacterium]|nr:AMP-binding protein [Gammaproteobacteria bacterium]
MNTNKIYHHEQCLKYSLCQAINEAWKRPFYRTHWKFDYLETAIDFINRGNFSSLPVVRKNHISEYWEQLIDYGDFVDIVSSSGTTGRPVDIPIHKQHQVYLVECITRVLKELGIKQKSKIINLLSLNDTFTLGPLVWLASRELGAGCIRVSPQRVQRVINIIKYHKPEFVVGNPAFLVRIAQFAGKEWLSKNELPKHAYFAASPIFDHEMKLTPAAEEAIQLWGIQSFLNEYGCSEFGSIGYECHYHKGIHVNTDHCYLELLDPSTGKPVNLGEAGEVVVTGLSFPRGFIPIRYATGDISAWSRKDKCQCGREGLRIGPIIGRVDYQLKLFGQTIFPELLLNVVDRLDCVSRSIITIKRNTNQNDLIEIIAVPADGYNASSTKNRIETELLHHLPVIPDVVISSNEHIDKLEQNAMQKTNQVKIPRLFLL